MAAPKGKKVEGEIIVSNKEKEWTFTPTENWSFPTYRIQIKAELEDLAGNNLNHPFDKDLTQTDSEKETEFKAIKFTVD